MPEPQAEEPRTGAGRHRRLRRGATEPLVPDLSASANPAIENAPAETSEGEDTSTKATERDEDSDDVEPTEEAPV